MSFWNSATQAAKTVVKAATPVITAAGSASTRTAIDEAGDRLFTGLVNNGIGEEEASSIVEGAKSRAMDAFQWRDGLGTGTKDGVIDRSEFNTEETRNATGMSEEETDRVFTTIDLNGDGVLDATEWIAFDTFRNLTNVKDGNGKYTVNKANLDTSINVGTTGTVAENVTLLSEEGSLETYQVTATTFLGASAGAKIAAGTVRTTMNGQIDAMEVTDEEKDGLKEGVEETANGLETFLTNLYDTNDLDHNGLLAFEEWATPETYRALGLNPESKADQRKMLHFYKAVNFSHKNGDKVDGISLTEAAAHYFYRMDHQGDDSALTTGLVSPDRWAVRNAGSQLGLVA